MATKDLQHIDYISKSGKRLDLFGYVIGWSDSIKTGVVEKQVVKRIGAIHQRIGAPPRKFEFRCVITPANQKNTTITQVDVNAIYNQIVDTFLEQPEGKFTHPRFGTKDVVIEEIGASETPGDATDTIEFTIKVSETGLTDAPSPAAAAKGQSSTVQAQATVTRATSLGLSVASITAVTNVSTRADSLLIALQAAETGTGTLLDVDASLAALSDSVAILDGIEPNPEIRRGAYLTLALALQARNSFITGKPQIVRRRIDTPVSLSGLMQELFGSRASAEVLVTERLNRIRTPHLIPVGTWLLVTDPDTTVEG